MENYTKSHWRDAAAGGASLGVAIALFSVAAGLLGLYERAPWAISTFNFAAIAVSVYVFGQRRAVRYGERGFSYGQGLAFIASMMLFAGFIAGVGNFVTYRWVIADYYANYIDEYLGAVTAGMGTALPKGGEEMIRTVMNSPLVIIFSTLFNIVVYGVFIGLVASVFIKRPEGTLTRNGE